jgi:carotenoid cleavage dioxygenase
MTASRRQFLGGLAGMDAAFAIGGSGLGLIQGCSTGATSASPSTSFPPPDPSSPWWMQGVYAPVKQEVVAQDLPSIDRRYSGRRNAYGWFANAVDDGPGGAVQLPGMTRLDVATGTTDSWLPGAWLAAGEGVFAAAGPDEGEGYILGIVTDRRTMASSLVVLDAMDMSAGPVAWVDLPQRVPVGFHGAWMADG